MISKATAVAKRFWKRLPHIALYTVAFTAIALAGRELYRATAPGTWYMNYESFTVQDAREGEDVIFTACRNRIGNYDLDGRRNIFEIKDNNKVLAGSVPVKGTSTLKRCFSGTIEEKVFHHRPGNYTLTNIFKFNVGRYEKRVEFESDPYKITERSELSVEETKQKIKNLEVEIERLRKALEESDGISVNVAPIQSLTPNNSSVHTRTQPPIITEPQQTEGSKEKVVEEQTPQPNLNDRAGGLINDVLGLPGQLWNQVRNIL